MNPYFMKEIDMNTFVSAVQNQSARTANGMVARKSTAKATVDLFFKIGLITVIGLAAKNAILIVEFAVEQRAAGKNLRDATIEAARLRFRPILMTSFAFILGVLPLAISTGAGSGSQRAIGTGVMGGMITATVLAIFLVPVFFVVVRSRFKESKAQHEREQARLEASQKEI